MNIGIGYNTSHYAWLLRSNLIVMLRNLGHNITVFAPHDRYSQRLAALGARHVDITLGNGMTPFADILATRAFYCAFKLHQLDVYLGFTIKPNIYGTVAAQALGIPTINNIAGLGSVFIRGGLGSLLAERLYKVALSRSNTVLFQNHDDMSIFIERKIVRANQSRLIPGSGVDLREYQRVNQTARKDPLPLTFLLVGRMLLDKGIGEFVEAARLLRGTHRNLRFQLLGPLDVNNPSALTRDQIDSWVSEGVIEYLGSADDVRPFIAQADCVVLPSYREGVPRALLEAAAMGKPIVSTNATGCRDVVDHGVNGFLCAVRDYQDLAAQMMKMYDLPESQRQQMGEMGRLKVEAEFDERLVLGVYRELIENIERRSRSTR